MDHRFKFITKAFLFVETPVEGQQVDSWKMQQEQIIKHLCHAAGWGSRISWQSNTSAI